MLACGWSTLGFLKLIYHIVVCVHMYVCGVYIHVCMYNIHICACVHVLGGGHVSTSVLGIVQANRIYLTNADLLNLGFMA